MNKELANKIFEAGRSYQNAEDIFSITEKQHNVPNFNEFYKELIDSEWYLFSEKFPDADRKIKVDKDGEIIETETYLYNGMLMIKLKDSNSFFEGMSPKLYNQKTTKWKYNE